MIDIKIMDKSFFKEDKSTMRTVNRGIQKLEARLSEYLTNNKKIENIFNDDVLIHDIINKRFYVYKCQVDRIQLRILYTVIDESMIIISHYCKKAPTKEYINYFENLTLYAQVKEKIINPISTFVLSDTDITLENGFQFHISASQDNLIYISHNTDIAVVSKEGTITAVGEGTAVITVSNSDGYEVLMIITVIPASNYIKGDVDGNGDFNIEDVALLQRWLLADPNAHLKKWEAGDLCKDDRLDVFDLCMMRRLLIGG